MHSVTALLERPHRFFRPFARASTTTVHLPPNGSHAKLQRQEARAEATRNAGCTFAPRSAAREDCQAGVPPSELHAHEGLQPRTEARR
jgi:hypothetical protein